MKKALSNTKVTVKLRKSVHHDNECKLTTFFWYTYKYGVIIRFFQRLRRHGMMPHLLNNAFITS